MMKKKIIFLFRRKWKDLGRGKKVLYGKDIKKEEQKAREKSSIYKKKSKDSGGEQLLECYANPNETKQREMQTEKKNWNKRVGWDKSFFSKEQRKPIPIKAESTQDAIKMEVFERYHLFLRQSNWMTRFGKRSEDWSGVSRMTNTLTFYSYSKFKF